MYIQQQKNVARTVISSSAANSSWLASPSYKKLIPKQKEKRIPPDPRREIL
jgi:hypothetical protein